MLRCFPFLIVIYIKHSVCQNNSPNERIYRNSTGDLIPWTECKNYAYVPKLNETFCQCDGKGTVVKKINSSNCYDAAQLMRLYSKYL